MGQSNQVEHKPNRIQTQSGEDFQWGLKIPMRDGIELHGVLYKPSQPAPVPVILTVTPYTMEGLHARGRYFSRQGYAFVIVDSRGRGNSQGDFEPFVNEARDGYDIVEWLAKQPWCDGQVAMWGGSYRGTVQWQTLGKFSLYLKTIVPTASAYAGVDFPGLGNIFTAFDIQWLTYVSGVTHNEDLMDDADFWIDQYQEIYKHHLPFNQLDRIAGNPCAIFQTWLKHPHPDAYWDQMLLTPDQYDRISQPILTITGQYDDDQPGALEWYHQHMASASPSKDEHYLVLGPWDHPGTRDPKPEFGGIKVGEASLIDMNNLHKEWYDWRLKAGDKPTFLEKRVVYYVMGEEKWKYADRLEAIPAVPQMLYISSDGNAGDVFHSGTLQAELPSGRPFDAYTYDPLDTRFGDMERTRIKNHFTSQIHALNLFGNGLVYHTDPFNQAVEITGWVKFFAWISMDVPDTDFMVTLFEVLVDGTVIRLTQDLLRARYRESERDEVLVKPGEINLYTFEGFTFFSRRIAAGSRLRLVLACPNSIYLEKNYNSGGVVAEESGADARTAHITLFHDQEHPSHIEISIVV